MAGGLVILEPTCFFIFFQSYNGHFLKCRTLHNGHERSKDVIITHARMPLTAFNVPTANTGTPKWQPVCPDIEKPILPNMLWPNKTWRNA